MWEALRVAQAAEFVEAMSGGLDATIEQGGTNVSGGQRQRLSIARALVRKPEIYLFDDSFSALDLATDARLRAALEPYTRDAAVLIVAHRASTISTDDPLLAPERPRLAFIAVTALATTILNVLGPRVLGRGTDVIVQGVIRHHGTDFAKLHHILVEAATLYVSAAVLGVLIAYTLAGVVQRL